RARALLPDPLPPRPQQQLPAARAARAVRALVQGRGPRLRHSGRNCPGRTQAMTTFLFVLLADETPETYGKGVKFLAVLGGAVVGGFLVGFLCSLMARALSGQKMNAWALRIVRILGAIISGWIMWWFIFGPGGGFGWPGGPGTGPGTNHTGTGKDGPPHPQQHQDQPPV